VETNHGDVWGVYHTVPHACAWVRTLKGEAACLYIRKDAHTSACNVQRRQLARQRVQCAPNREQNMLRGGVPSRLAFRCGRTAIRPNRTTMRRPANGRPQSRQPLVQTLRSGREQTMVDSFFPFFFLHETDALA